MKQVVPNQNFEPIQAQSADQCLQLGVFVQHVDFQIVLDGSRRHLASDLLYAALSVWENIKKRQRCKTLKVEQQ